MYRLLFLSLSLISIYVFADNIENQELLEANYIGSSLFNERYDNVTAPADIQIAKKNTPVDSLGFAKTPSTKAIRQNEVEEQQTMNLAQDKLALKNKDATEITGSNRFTINSALNINQQNHLVVDANSFSDDKSTPHSSEQKFDQINQKQFEQLKLDTNLNLSDVAINFCKSNTIGCIKEFKHYHKNP